MFSQSFSEGELAFTGSIGTPHTFRNAVRLITKTDLFKETFEGYVEVKVTGMNPTSYKGEYGVHKMFGVGVCVASWNMQAAVTDKYNVVRPGQSVATDEIDTYKFKMSSISFGVRPNFHFPFENKKTDLYIGVGLGFTKNSLTIDFASTDVNKVLPIDHYSFSLPGGFYFAPTLGYRYYFANFVGLNFELGWDKGAILQGGIALHFQTKKKTN